MRIAHIVAYAKGEHFGNRFDCEVDFLEIEKEEEDHYIVKDHEDGLQPRSNILYKEINEDAASCGYESLNMPGWIQCDTTWETSGTIYVLEGDVEEGKTLLKQALVENLEKNIKRYELLKNLIQNG